MSRKDYVALAEALRASEDLVEAIRNVADVLQADNPNFNRQRFLEAALGKDSK